MPSTAKQAKATAYESVRSHPFTRIHGRPTRNDFDTLKEDLLKYVETPSVCREFIDFLKKNDFSMLLVRVLEEEDMEDVLIDNPYLAKLV